MGATVATNKQVAGFTRPNGEVIYILFEETYEKNCYPHTPNWGCRAIGNFSQVMLKVFRSAAACEGGSLQVRSGPTRPETYIQRWRDAFAKPAEMPNIEIELKLGGDSLYSTIPSSKVDFVCETLAKIGRHDLVESLKAGPVSLPLYQNVDVFIAIYGNDGQLPPWKVLERGHTLASVNQRLVPAQASGGLHIPSVKAFKIDKENILIRSDDGKWQHAGWQYAAVGAFIHTTALEAELQRTGAATSTIAAFRAACATAPALPTTTKISIEVGKSGEQYRRDNAAKLAVSLKRCADRSTAPEQFEVTFAEILAADCEYELTLLDNAQVTWSVPEQGVTTNGTHPQIAATCTQPSLF